jgi:hypothetical protein
MANGNKRKKKGGRYTSPLSAHKRQGTRVIPPMLNVPNLSFSSWTKDALPDFLWICAHLVKDPLKGMHETAKALDVIDDVLKDAHVERPSYGCLTQFEAFPLELRQPVLNALEDQEIYERSFPKEFAHALGMYSGAPGSWLIDPWRARGLSVDPEIAQRYLAPIVTESFHGQSLIATRAKFMYLRGMVKAGRLSVPADSDLPDLFSRYPEGLTEEERNQTEPVIRTTFGGMMDLEGNVIHREWCERFWRSNWKLYVCIQPQSASAPSTSEHDSTNVAEVFHEFRDASSALLNQFESVALRVDPDLYAPDRYEVITGIAARVVRLVAAATDAPLLWTDEYGAGLMRSVVEAKILIRWLEHKSDPGLYAKFKEYGRGRLKLLKLHTEEHADSLNEVPDHLAAYLEHLNAEVNADIWEEYQEISIDKTFSGVTARQMAIDVNLKSDYDFVFAPASGTAHGDWTALDRYALARCRNPLHLWHRIPNFDVGILADPSVMETLLNLASDVVDEYTVAFARSGLSSE